MQYYNNLSLSFCTEILTSIFTQLTTSPDNKSLNLSFLIFTEGGGSCSNNLLKVYKKGQYFIIRLIKFVIQATSSPLSWLIQFWEFLIVTDEALDTL